MKMVHLVFIPSPAVGHIFSTMEFVNLLLHRQPRLSVTVLLMALPTESHRISYDQSLAAAGAPGRITFVNLPPDDYVSDAKTPGAFLSGLIDHHKPRVRDFIDESTRSESTRPAGIVFDMFCTTMMDAADEFGVPSYVYFTSGAGFLSLALHALDRDLTEFKNSDTELAVPGFVNSVPAQALPVALLDGDWSELFKAGRFKDAKGILVNTFLELESYAMKHLSENNAIPPIYPVGPVLNLKVGSQPQYDEIVKWLDNQPTSSVVFLCFGSMGCFVEDQVIEISRALENSGTRFLWSLRRTPPKEKVEFSGNYENVTTILPEGFLGRTAKIGRVIGWAPQLAILSHPAIGGFVSHCGWNSILESLWFGVPVATWPLYAEQHRNAYQLVKELGLAVELRLDNRQCFDAEENYLVTTKEIENGIKQLMEVNNAKVTSIKPKVMEMSKKSRMAVAKGGSSYGFLDRFIEDVIDIGSENF